MIIYHRSKRGRERGWDRERKGEGGRERERERESTDQIGVCTVVTMVFCQYSPLLVAVSADTHIHIHILIYTQCTLHSSWFGVL